jgi:hypothetical protein
MFLCAGSIEGWETALSGYLPAPSHVMLGMTGGGQNTRICATVWHGE